MSEVASLSLRFGDIRVALRHVVVPSSILDNTAISRESASTTHTWFAIAALEGRWAYCLWFVTRWVHIGVLGEICHEKVLTQTYDLT